MNTIEATQVIIKCAEIGCVQQERNKEKNIFILQKFIIFIDACILEIPFCNFLMFVIKKLFERMSTLQITVSFDNKTN